MIRIRGLLIGATLSAILVGSSEARAGLIRFSFDFRDGSGASVGTGFYQFDEILPDTMRTFTSLTNFSWEFDLPSLGLFLSSANGDIPSNDPGDEEGIVLTGPEGSRTLQFFDTFAVNILHRDVSQPFPTGVNFPEYSNVAQYHNPGLVDAGTFIATETQVPPVPEPASILMLSTGLLGLLVHGWRRRGGVALSGDRY